MALRVGDPVLISQARTAFEMLDEYRGQEAVVREVSADRAEKFVSYRLELPDGQLPWFSGSRLALVGEVAEHAGRSSITRDPEVIGGEEGVRMPKVEPPTERSLEQALLVRLYTKGLRITVEGRSDSSKLSWQRTKGSKAMPTEEEQEMVAERIATVKTMLRFDRAYAAELVRDAHGTIARRYPLGSGCDLSETQRYMDEAHEAIDRESMHGVWYWLDRYVERALEICAAHRDQPELSQQPAPLAETGS